MPVKTVEDLLKEVEVLSPGRWHNELVGTIGDWYAVSTEDSGIIAYFKYANCADRFRLDYINRLLHPDS